MFGNMFLTAFFRKKVISKKLILFGKKLEITYNHKQYFGVYDYK